MVTLPALDPEALDRMRAEHGSNWLGPTRPLPIDIGGTWAWTQKGKRIWRVTIRATAARALRLRFEDFNVPGAVWLYSDEWRGPLIGPYRGTGPQEDGSFWSEFVLAENVTVEYVPDDEATASEWVPFQIRSVAQIVSERFPVPSERSKAVGVQPRSLAGCHLDVSCYPELQTRDQPSVARLYITDADATTTCTGFLINPKYDSGSHLLLLTAGHCIDSQEVASGVSFLWNYQTEECYGNPDWELWAEPLAYTYGATLVVAKYDRDDDFALLLLNEEDVAEVTGWWAEGWDTAAVHPRAKVFTVSHPSGHFKRAAFGEVVDFRWKDTSSASFGTIQWRLGTTEPGSSGSPVFKGAGKDRFVIGILTGGNGSSLDDESQWGPYCDSDLRSSFNRLDHIWDAIEPYMERESALSAATMAPTVPSRVVVQLGITDETVTLVLAEDGTWWLGGALVRSGETAVRTENGNVYRLALASDGTWTAVYSVERVSVGLGTSSERIILARSEDGRWWLGDAAVQEGTVVSSSNGTKYRLGLLGGRWVAVQVGE
ncbi:MAG: serine protease [Bryobacterales bacterium]|nr:serine protease [Bryobacterales bacterium]